MKHQHRIKLADSLSFNNILKSITKGSSEPILVTFVNPFSYYDINDDKALCEKFDYFFSDGSLLTILHNLLNSTKIDRVSFDYSSVAGVTLQHAQSEGLTVAFIGATEPEIQKAVANIQNRYPNLKIVYVRNGYIRTDKEENQVMLELIEKGADILICGMGAPRQENFLVRAKKAGVPSKVMFTCGGFLTQTALKDDYYHPFVKKFGVRWLQRAILHAHVRKRILLDYPKFTARFIREYFS
ncbi:WecB/TagA/CpsF family glycosyltransferase [Pseudohongiella spirulinae]|uniref:Teichoic acid biosynthesis protein A n=1 Tax=Pseudohongiella spirulinae TaxID=1249552 RepID=A0A0S2KDL3_9GAMM|nr:WecB/TagA/CpsF family glycosyltransferase [Pseudohongiella spirulinae]ALO46406.1 Teichoic acid biosynthesis protein A [Pseudohongiella spirulinae]